MKKYSDFELEKAKRDVDKEILSRFLDKHSRYCYKIENDYIEISDQKHFNKVPEGFSKFSEQGIKDILDTLKEGSLFSEPFATNVDNTLLEPTMVPRKKVNEDNSDFKEILKKFDYPLLKAIKYYNMIKRPSLSDFVDTYKASNLDKKAVHSLLNHVPFRDLGFDSVKKGIEYSFEYLDNMVKIVEENAAGAINDEKLTQMQQLVQSKKEQTINNFIENNPTFFKNPQNKTWFVSVVEEINKDIQIRQLLNEEDSVDLFMEDTWKHATIEISKHGLFKNFPMNKNVSSHLMQSEYKSILSQFSNFIASNDTKQKWGIHVEQAHVGTKKNGNYLISLTHSEENPDTKKFKQALTSFLDYLKPNLLAMERTYDSSKVLKDKSEMRKIMTSFILAADLENNLPKDKQKTKSTKKI